MSAPQQPSPPTRERVGWIGVGSMGWPMAARLAQAGVAVTVYDKAAQQAQRFAQETGARVADSPRALAAQSDVVVTMLPTSAHVEDALSGSDGALAALAPGSLVMDMSSGVPAHTRRLAQMAADAGSHLVDAPVSGGVARARSGELAIMFGGADAHLVLSVLGASILPTGDVGCGHAMKALNNLVSAGGFLIGVEALLIGQQFGLDPARMVDVLNASTGMNNSTQKKFKQFVLSREFNSGFGLDLMVKDVGIALGLAQDAGVPAPFAAVCTQLWAAAAKTLGQGQDHTAMARAAEQWAGVTLGDSHAAARGAC